MMQRTYLPGDRVLFFGEYEGYGEATVLDRTDAERLWVRFDISPSEQRWISSDKFVKYLGPHNLYDLELIE